MDILLYLTTFIYIYLYLYIVLHYASSMLLTCSRGGPHEVSQLLHLWIIPYIYHLHIISYIPSLGLAPEVGHTRSPMLLLIRHLLLYIIKRNKIIKKHYLITTLHSSPEVGHTRSPSFVDALRSAPVAEEPGDNIYVYIYIICIYIYIYIYIIYICIL